MSVPVDIEAYGGSQCHGQIIAKAIIPNAFVAAAFGQRVDGHRRIGNGKSTKGTAMEGAHYAKQQQGAGRKITAKEQEKEEKAEQQNLSAGKGVYKIAADGAEEQCCDGIAR